MHHHHEHSLQKFNLAFIIAIVLNAAFVVIEAIYAYSAHSTSLLADAGHNLGDVLGLMMAWVAMLLLAKKATDKYSYGFKRTTILAAIVNALLLIITTFVILYESLEKLLHPHAVNELQVIIVAAIGIVINGATALLFAKGQHDLNIKAAFLHLAYDALISVAVVITGIIIWWTGWLIVDPIVGLLIAVTIFYGAWRLLRDSVNLIMDAVPHNIDQEKITHFLVQYPGVKECHHLHIWGLSTNETALTTHLVMPNGISDAELDDLHQQLAKQFAIHHATIQVERGEQDGCCH